MFKDRQTLFYLAVILVAFGAGTTLGRWMSSATTSSVPAVSSKPVAQATATPAAGAEKPKPMEDELDRNLVNKATEPAKTSSAPGPSRPVEEILKGRNPSRVKELEQFAESISPSEIGATLKKLDKMPESDSRDLASSLLVARWIESDLDGALQFATENKDFDYIANDIFQQLAADNLTDAIARAQGITSTGARYQAFRGVLSQMVTNDPQGALRLAGTLGNFGNNESLSAIIYRQWATQDPQAAAVAAAQDPSANNDRWRSPVGQVLRNWANQDPLAAIAWTSSLPDAGMQSRNISQIVREWSRDDFNAAANWVNSVPGGPTRDAATSALAFSLSGNDPAGALKWAQSMSDAGERENTLRMLARQIYYRNPSNGAAILQAAGVPAELIPNPSNQQGGRGGRGPGGRGPR